MNPSVSNLFVLSYSKVPFLYVLAQQSPPTDKKDLSLKPDTEFSAVLVMSAKKLAAAVITASNFIKKYIFVAPKVNMPYFKNVLNACLVICFLMKMPLQDQLVSQLTPRLQLSRQMTTNKCLQPSGSTFCAHSYSSRYFFKMLLHLTNKLCSKTFLWF